jgi:hypothetical protein
MNILKCINYKKIQKENDSDKLLRMVIDYSDGNGKYNFSNLNKYDKANARFDAWQVIRSEIDYYFYLKGKL